MYFSRNVEIYDSLVFVESATYSPPVVVDVMTVMDLEDTGGKPKPPKWQPNTKVE